jgi:hypothetical protein
MVDILSRPRVERTLGTEVRLQSALRFAPKTLGFDRDVLINTYMKRPAGLFVLVDRSTTPALRSKCSQPDRLMRSERDIRCSSRICLRSGCGLRILFEVPAGIWGKPHPIDVGFRVDVWISTDSQIRVATRQRGKAACKSIACSGLNGAPEEIRTAAPQILS